MIKRKTLKLKFLKGQKISNKKQKLMTVSIILIIGITFFSGVSVGKAVYNTNIKNKTQIAKPILEVEKESEIMITEDNKKGEYKFLVKNYNQEEEISQVDLTYYIEILEEDLEDCITYELYKENEKIELKENKTEEMVLHKDVKEEQNYTLKVMYNQNKNTIEDIMQDIQIKVHSEQLKI